MEDETYCNDPYNDGLTCKPEDLKLLRRLTEDLSANSKYRVFLYQCKACRGFYKYVYLSVYQVRNFDNEAGWFEYDDHYYKVGEKNPAGRVEFPLAEARIYGYRHREAD